MRLQQIAINELNKEIDNFHKKDSAVFHHDEFDNEKYVKKCEVDDELIQFIYYYDLRKVGKVVTQIIK
ncbi:hypothetical protein VSK91_15650 [Bacillus swezeyi]|uniref:hypothetical protein n=1 Tax=Bacillus swezeyi TaxID=1925020 RepID=UPI0039C5CB83